MGVYFLNSFCNPIYIQQVGAAFASGSPSHIEPVVVLELRKGIGCYYVKQSGAWISCNILGVRRQPSILP